MPGKKTVLTASESKLSENARTKQLSKKEDDLSMAFKFNTVEECNESNESQRTDLRSIEEDNPLLKKDVAAKLKNKKEKRVEPLPTGNRSLYMVQSLQKQTDKTQIPDYSAEKRAESPAPIEILSAYKVSTQQPTLSTQNKQPADSNSLVQRQFPRSFTASPLPPTPSEVNVTMDEQAGRFNLNPLDDLSKTQPSKSALKPCVPPGGGKEQKKAIGQLEKKSIDKNNTQK